MSLTNWLGVAMLIFAFGAFFYHNCKTLGLRTTLIVWVCSLSITAFIGTAGWLVAL